MLCWLLRYFWYYSYSRNPTGWEFFDPAGTLVAGNLLNCLCAANVMTVFLAAAAGTKLPDDVNRSIRQTYCVRTSRDGPYWLQASSPATTLFPPAHCAYISQINSNKYVFLVSMIRPVVSHVG